jgi:hypothetical protein
MEKMVVIKTLCVIYLISFHNNMICSQQPQLTKPATAPTATPGHSRHQTEDMFNLPKLDPAQLTVPPVASFWADETPQTASASSTTSTVAATVTAIAITKSVAEQIAHTQPVHASIRSFLSPSSKKPDVVIGAARFSELKKTFDEKQQQKIDKDSSTAKKNETVPQLVSLFNKHSAAKPAPAMTTFSRTASLASSSAATSTQTQPSYEPTVVEVVDAWGDDEVLHRASVASPRVRGATKDNIFNYFTADISLQEIEEFIKMGNDPDSKGKNGETLLMLAVEYNRPDIVQYLAPLSTLLLPNNEHQNTALHIAAGVGNVKIAQLIIDAQKTRKNSDLFKMLHAKNCDELTPIEVANELIAHIKETKEEAEAKKGAVLIPELGNIIALLKKTEAELMPKPQVPNPQAKK